MFTKSKTLLAGLVFLASGTIGAQESAVQSSTTGFTAGLSLIGAKATADIPLFKISGEGAGLNLEVGWGFTPSLTAFVGLSGATLDSNVDFKLRQADFGLRYLILGMDSRVRPYAEAALAVRQVSADWDISALTVSAKGNGMSLLGGAGVQIFVNPSVAFDLGVSYSSGSIGDWSVSSINVPIPDADVSSTQLRAGVRFWPSAR